MSLPKPAFGAGSLSESPGWRLAPCDRRRARCVCEKMTPSLTRRERENDSSFSPRGAASPAMLSESPDHDAVRVSGADRLRHARPLCCRAVPPTLRDKTCDPRGRPSPSLGRRATDPRSSVGAAPRAMLRRERLATGLNRVRASCCRSRPGRRGAASRASGPAARVITPAGPSGGPTIPAT
jgi:hypothetical protein